MPSLKTAGQRFASVFYTEKGVPFEGRVSTPNDGEPRALQMGLPRRILRVEQDAKVRERDVFTTPSGHRFLVAAQDAADNYQGVIYRHHLLIQMTEHLLWTRTIEEYDPVTRLERSRGEEEVGHVWVTLEPAREEVDRATFVHSERFKCFTGADLKLGDQVGKRIVKTAYQLLGVTVADVQ